MTYPVHPLLPCRGSGPRFWPLSRKRHHHRATHRPENPGKLALTLIEVQTGGYPGEDDIVRHEDVHARGDGAKGQEGASGQAA